MERIRRNRNTDSQQPIASQWRWAFLFPLLAREQPTRSPMNSTNTIEAPAKPATRCREAAPLDALRDIYLGIGLSPENARRSARADYECGFCQETPWVA